jgi:hypothetical protein
VRLRLRRTTRLRLEPSSLDPFLTAAMRNMSMPARYQALRLIADELQIELPESLARSTEGSEMGYPRYPNHEVPYIEERTLCQAPEEDITLDPSDEFERKLIEMVKLSRLKRHDYAGDDDPWQNFYDSAEQVNDTAGKSVETLIGTKQARLRQLLFKNRQPKNESVRDTILDRAVYSVIALCIFDRGDYDTPTQ